MLFKLIRVDIEEPSKIQLKVGKHIIGRGKFLHNDDSDKRVSRNHAEIEVTEDLVTLKALHQNPCFYVKNSNVDTEILHINNSINLNNGDKFGLIPDTFWYEVIHCADADIDKNDKEYVNTDNYFENEVVKTEENEVNSPQSNITTNGAENDDDEAINSNMSEEDTSRAGSPSVLNTEESSSTQAYPVNSPPRSPSSNPSKRPNDSPSTLDVKKVKAEPTTPSVDAQPGTSNDQAASDSDSKDQKPNIVPPASPPQPQPRERCIYGANCYRRNPSHKAQFSHPPDADWGAGARGVCPYGRACVKRDPRHWGSHEHPPGVALPGPQDNNPPRRPGHGTNRRPKRKSNSSESEDDSLPTDLIVTGKRARNTVKTNEFFDTQSDENEDPFNTDESDEWQPSSDVTNSGGFSQN